MNVTTKCWPTMLKHKHKNEHSKAGIFLERENVEHLWPCENKADAAKSMSQVNIANCAQLSELLLTFVTDVA
jgi:hypothetical protein